MRFSFQHCLTTGPVGKRKLKRHTHREGEIDRYYERQRQKDSERETQRQGKRDIN